MTKPFLPALLCLCLVWTPVLAEEAGQSLHESLQQEHRRADQREQEVRKLTEQAGRLSSSISGIEREMADLLKRIAAQEAELDSVRQAERAAREEHYALEREKQRISDELAGLVRSLWPVHLQSVRSRFEGVDSWAEFDRRKNWLADIYEATRARFEEARINAERIARNLERQRTLEQEAEAQLARVNLTKDRLLDRQHTLRRNLRSVTRQREDAEAELTAILSSIESLKYQLQSQKTKRFDLYKRTLPWPVRGRLVADYAPGANPPVRGVGLGAQEADTVRSVFWGKVVHNDTLRGFGHVVIVYHGHDYYSLYAYLSDTHVLNGQEVEKDEPLGVVGYYPAADGPGLYFELRFHQKPINPKVWLTSP